MLNRHKDNLLTGFIKYNLQSEKVVNQTGRTYDFGFFESFISIDESSFYFHRESSIFILATRKDLFKAFCKDYKECKFIKFESIEVDFQHIIDDRNSLSIDGIWLGRIDDVNLRALNLLGNHVEDSTTYTDLIERGAEIKNLTILYAFNGKQLRIMITKDGGIILVDSMDESDALALVKDVYETLLS